MWWGRADVGVCRRGRGRVPGGVPGGEEDQSAEAWGRRAQLRTTACPRVVARCKGVSFAPWARTTTHHTGSPPRRHLTPHVRPTATTPTPPRCTLYEPEHDRVIERTPGFFSVRGARTREGA